MARWRLVEAHYLNVPGTVWEQMETDRETGRQRRKAYPVPLHLDPKAAADWNYRPNGGHVSVGGNTLDEGMIIVCWEGKGEKKDIVFIGNPTPSMEPFDEEAEEITASLKPTWHDPINEFDLGISASEQMVIDAHKQMTEAMVKLSQPNPEFTALMGTMVKMMEQNAAILAMLANPMMEGRRG